jgi:hypothetical protein
MNKEKNQKLAAFLNFILPGVGYIYNGNRVIFGTILLVGYLVGLVSESDIDSLKNFDIISALIFLFGFGYDAYNEAGNINVNLNKI